MYHKAILDTLKKFSDWMIDKATTAKDDVSAAANDYLKTLGYVSIAYAWIKVLEVRFLIRKGWYA